MRTLTRFRWLAALVLWLGPLLAAHATHLLGGEITYSSIASTTAGVPRYHIVVRLFRDATKSADTPLMTLYCSKGGCAATGAGSFTLNIPRGQDTPVSSVGCVAGTFPLTYRVSLYETDTDLPTGQWTLSLTEVNRTAGIMNMPNSSNNSLYVSTYLDNTLATQDASPRFLSTLLPYIPNNQAQRFSFSAFDTDGDSLRYEFRLPEMSMPVVGATPNGCGTPTISTLSPHFALNSATGVLTTLATATIQQGMYAMAARVTEYRRINGSWQLIGYVTREVTYVVIGSINQTPRFTSLRLNGATTTQPLDQPIRVQPGQTVALALTAADPDAGQNLRFESQAPSVVPGLSLQTTGATSAQLTWQVPATLPLGRYTATVAVLDDGCPNASEEYTFVFVVAAQPLAARPSQGAAAEAYPMPFREQVQFQTSVGGQVITIVDGVGRVVARLSAAADGRVLWQPAPSLPAGLYLARSADGRPLARLLRAE